MGFKTFSGLANCPRCVPEDKLFLVLPGTELFVQKELYKGLFAEFGINFQERGLRFDFDYINSEGQYEKTVLVKEQYFFVGFPLSLGYSFKGFYAKVGAGLNHFVFRRFLRDGELVSTDKAVLQNHHWGSQVAAGYVFPVSDRLKIDLGVIHSALYITNSRARLVTRGMSVGLSYSLDG
ncbi:MAG: hypothetical protein WEC59_04465 [Salibacteraceae bacterium]